MIELLVVITIMAILISVVAVASTALIGRARTNSTLSLLAVVNQAVEDFKREKPPVTQKPAYLKRYGLYPPDELEVFGKSGFAKTQSAQSIAPGGAHVVPNPGRDGYAAPMQFYPSTNLSTGGEHRDLAAMILAIETLTESAASILAQIPERNRVAGDLEDGTPSRFLDRPAAANSPPDGNWDSNAQQIRYIVDDWGIPLGYMAQRDHTVATEADRRSPNHNDWNRTSTDLVRLNGGAPVIFSWGPDGKEQLTKDVMDADPTASIIGDWMDPESQGQLNHPMNADNVYANQALKDKLQAAPQQ